jgi:hypothetical protein
VTRNAPAESTPRNPNHAVGGWLASRSRTGAPPARRRRQVVGRLQVAAGGALVASWPSVWSVGSTGWADIRKMLPLSAPISVVGASPERSGCWTDGLPETGYSVEGACRPRLRPPRSARGGYRGRPSWRKTVSGIRHHCSGTGVTWMRSAQRSSKAALIWSECSPRTGAGYPQLRHATSIHPATRRELTFESLDPARETADDHVGTSLFYWCRSGAMSSGRPTSGGPRHDRCHDEPTVRLPPSADYAPHYARS